MVPLCTEMRDPRIEGPSEIASFGDPLYLANSWVESVPNPTPQTPYNVVAMPKPHAAPARGPHETGGSARTPKDQEEENMKRHIVVLTTVLALSPVGAAPVIADTLATPAASSDSQAFPTEFSIPDGYLAKGIAIGHEPTAYIASGANGSIDRVDLRTGQGEIISPPIGKRAAGIHLDDHGRLFVAGAESAEGRVVDVRTGRTIKTYQLSTQPNAFAADAFVNDKAAWFTDPFNAVLYKLSLGPGGSLPNGVETIPVSGAGYAASHLTTGITQTPDGRAIIIAQVETGKLFRVDPDTGAATQVDLGGQIMTGADGMFLDGQTLYVAQMHANIVNKITLNAAGTSGRLVTRVTDPQFDGSACIASFGDRLYVTNTREVSVPNPTPQTPYRVVAIRKP